MIFEILYTIFILSFYLTYFLHDKVYNKSYCVPIFCVNLFENCWTGRIWWDVSYYRSLRAPTVDVGYVPNVKYLAHIPHQTHFMPIYQMLYMLNFLQLATVKSHIYNHTEQSGILIYYFLFLFQPSFLLQLTASISFSTLPFFFFFPLPRCSTVFPFLKKKPPSISFLPSLI